MFDPVLGIRMFLGLPDADPFVRSMDPIRIRILPFFSCLQNNIEKKYFFCILKINEGRSWIRSWIWSRICRIH
jgi:hypothetical protein